MVTSAYSKAAATAAAIVFVLSDAPADAWDKGEAKCRATISKGLGKYVSTAQKAVGGCHKSRAKGKISSSKNCNDLSVRLLHVWRSTVLVKYCSTLSRSRAQVGEASLYK